MSTEGGSSPDTPPVLTEELRSGALKDLFALYSRVYGGALRADETQGTRNTLSVENADGDEWEDDRSSDSDVSDDPNFKYLPEMADLKIYAVDLKVIVFDVHGVLFVSVYTKYYSVWIIFEQVLEL